MVSFCCDHCQEIIKKPKAEMHVRRCYPAALSCVDCYKTFTGTAFKAHTSCITEEQKFHGKLYKGDNNNGKQQPKQQHQAKQKQQQQQAKPAAAPAAPITPAASPAPMPTAAATESSKKRTASTATSSDSSSSSSESDSDSEPAKKKAKTEASAAAGPSGGDVKQAIETLGEVSNVSYKDLVKRTIKAVRKAHPSMDKGKAKKLVKEHIRFNVAGGKVTLA